MQIRQHLLIGILFIVLLSVAMTLVAFGSVTPSLSNILMLLVGLFTMSTLTAFHRLIETTERRSAAQVTFNEHIVTNQIETAAKDANVDIIDAEASESRREVWDFVPEDLLGQDNTLALAMLRIEIERELRKLAASAGLGAMAPRLSIRRLAETLQSRGALDLPLISALNDILPIANQAVHSQEVSTETTETILRIGRQLLTLLRVTHKRLISGL